MATNWPSIFRSSSGRVYSLADQGLQGIANIVAMSALGRHLVPAQFGAVGVAIGIYYFVFGFHRSLVIIPYITEHYDSLGAAADRRYHSNWWWYGVCTSLILSAILGLLALTLQFVCAWYPAWRWGITPLALGALMTPPLVWAEHVRRWLYKIERPDGAALAALIYAALLVCGAIVLPRFQLDALGGALAWVAAGLGASLIPLAVLRPGAFDSAASLACLARHRAFASWLALNNLPYSFFSSATVVVLIGMINGPLAAAVFTAARTLTNPAVSIMSAVDSIDKPRAARALAQQGEAGLRNSVHKTRMLLIAVTGAYLALVAVLAPILLDLVYHGKYADISAEMRLIALSIFLFCLNQPSETLLIVLRASRTLFVTRTLTAAVTIAALALGSRHGTMGMAVAVVAAQAANLLFLAIAEFIVERRHRPSAGLA